MMKQKQNQNRVDIVDAYLTVPIEIVRFLWARKLWWLVPVAICLLIIGGMLLLAASSPVAPFIYPLF
jgi:hypothetical protein